MYMLPKFSLSVASTMSRCACPSGLRGRQGMLFTPSSVPVKRPAFHPCVSIISNVAGACWSARLLVEAPSHPYGTVIHREFCIFSKERSSPPAASQSSALHHADNLSQSSSSLRASPALHTGGIPASSSRRDVKGGSLSTKLLQPRSWHRLITTLETVHHRMSR